MNDKTINKVNGDFRLPFYVHELDSFKCQQDMARHFCMLLIYSVDD